MAKFGAARGLVVARRIDGVWSSARVALPAGASPDGYVQTRSADCSANVCVGAGAYIVGLQERSLVVEVTRTSITATGLPLLGSSSDLDTSAFWDVSCPQDNACVTVGQGFTSENVGHIAVQTGPGAWTVVDPPLPAGASWQGSGVFSVACAAPGECLASGLYLPVPNVFGNYAGSLLTLHNGSWSAGPAPLPAAAGGLTNRTSQIPALRCAQNGLCIAHYAYSGTAAGGAAAGGGGNLVRVNGAWSFPAVAVPSGAAADFWRYASTEYGCAATTVHSRSRERPATVIASTDGVTWRTSAPAWSNPVDLGLMACRVRADRGCTFVGRTVTLRGSPNDIGVVVTVEAQNALSPTPTPTISGTAKVGYTLTAKAGTWGPAPVTLKYQWKANGCQVPGLRRRRTGSPRATSASASR